MMTNKTAQFLGAEYSWAKAQLELHDVQALHGGVRVLLPSFSAYQFFVSCFAPDGEEKKYKLRLNWDEKKALCALCVEHDFLTIGAGDGGGLPGSGGLRDDSALPGNRMGLPDEARPAITLTNARQESHTVALWAGAVAQNERFAALYQALLALSERTAGQRPMPRRLESREKWLILALLALAVAFLGALSFFPARALAQAWWSTHFRLLFGVLAALMLSLVGLLALLWRGERKKMVWDRTFTNPFMLAAVNLFLFVGIVGATGMVEEAIALWRGAALPEADNARIWYGVLAYGGVFAAWLTVLAAALVGERLLRWIDARW